MAHSRPMVIQQGRWKLGALFVLFAALALVLAFLTFVSAYLPDLWRYLGISLFAPVGIASAVAAVSSGASLWRPGTITADESGVTYRTWRGVQRWAWAEIEEFIVFAPTSRLRSPGCKLAESVAGRRFVSFGRCWEKTAEDVVEGLKGERPRNDIERPSP